MTTAPDDCYTYCSYATEEGCQGVVILRGNFNPIEAAQRARELGGVSPGGQLVTVVISNNDIPPHLLDNVLNHLDQLVSPEDAKRLFEGEELG